MRVGRHGDLCHRVQAKGVKDVDDLKNAERKGSISKAIMQVKKEQEEERKNNLGLNHSQILVMKEDGKDKLVAEDLSEDLYESEEKQKN